MANLFISYSREDKALVENLTNRLNKAGNQAWRDQDKLYGGQQWPKALGEAIAAQEFFLLFWSKAAAQSHFVEFEWTTALALKKTIVPVILDQSELPPALKAVHAIFFRNIEYTLNEILKALKQPLPPASPVQQEKVIDALEQIDEVEPKKVIQKARAIFSQNNWQVQGSVYQAGGDIQVHIHEKTTPEKSPTRLDLSIKLFGLLAIVLIIVGVGWLLSERFTKEVLEEPPTCHLRGLVLDQNKMALAGVRITVDEAPGDTLFTTSDGGFYFPKIPGKVGDRVRIYAFKPGYQNWNEYVTLPGPVRIKLEAKP